MSKSGTGAGTVSERAFRRPREQDGSLPSTLAAAGLKALLINDRSAAWLPWSKPQVRDDQSLLTMPGEWDDRSGTRWTPDLVHCRLVEAGRILNRLPDITWPGQYGTVWRQLAPSAGARSVPSHREIDLCWWTVDRLLIIKPLIDQVIAVGFMLGMSSGRIEKLLRSGVVRGTVPVTAARIRQRYTRLRRQFMQQWNQASVPVDGATLELRQTMLDRGFK